MRPYLLVFAVAALATFVTTPVVRRLATKAGAIAIPSDRKVHLHPTPEWGGVAMFIGVAAAMGVALALSDFRILFRSSTEPFGVLAAALLITVIGALDDVRDLRGLTKLAAQFLASGVLVLGGVQIFYVWFPGIGVVSLSADLSAMITVLWTVALINAVNLVDGLDGLAAGVVGIASLSFFVYAFRTSDVPTTAALLTAIVAGACVGFLWWNFSPAKIFMGDAGSMPLGLLLASATVSGFGRTTEPQFIDVAGFFVPVLIPVIVMAIPLADAGFAILRRVRGGSSVFHADKQHIHHWLLDMANTHRRAVLVMYLWSTLLGAATLALALGPGIAWRYVSAGIGVVLVVSIVILPRLLRRGRPPRAAAVVGAERTADETR